MAKKVIVDLEAKVDKAIDGVEKLNDSVKDLRKDGAKATENLQKGVKEVGDSAKKSEKGVSKLAKGFKGIGVAIKAAGIGLVIAALSKLKEVFESNQAVADSFSVAFETISLVFNQVATAVIDTYTSVSKASENFDALGKVVKGLLTIAIVPLKLSFFGIKLGIQQAQLAWEKSVFGGKDPETINQLTLDILETKSALVEVGEDAIQAGKDIVNNVGEAAAEIGNITKIAGEELSKISISAAVEAAKTNVKLKKSAEIAAALNQGLIEKYDRQAEQLRQIRDDDTKGIAERIKANNALKLVLEEQKEAMLKNAKAILAAAQAEHSKNDNQENTIALLEAQNELTAISAQIEGFKSEQISNRIALEKESAELTRAKSENENALALDRKRFAAEQITDEVAKLEKLKALLESEKTIELERLQLKIDSFAAGTQARLDAENEFATKKQEIEQALVLNKSETTEAKKALGLKEVADDKAVADAKASIRNGNLNNASSAFALLGQLAGKNKKLQAIALIGESAVGIAKTVINTQTANAAAVLKYALLPGGAALAAAERTINNIGAGISIASNIAATSKGLRALGAGGAPSKPSVEGAGASTPQSPNFNIVGTSGTNQLASAIGGQEQQPVKAFVVSNDVTTAQSLDRNIIEGASLG